MTNLNLTISNNEKKHYFLVFIWQDIIKWFWVSEFEKKIKKSFAKKNIIYIGAHYVLKKQKKLL